MRKLLFLLIATLSLLFVSGVSKECQHKNECHTVQTVSHEFECPYAVPSVEPSFRWITSTDKGNLKHYSSPTVPIPNRKFRYSMENS